ncbi:hypothetical protein R3P38DRAFT_545989 [Favolaschia claudopus]|uniref:F-box domain-containing protein n=1 Tax=Favolaschia claudopus TaxID=2862362 RepID=A0AAW0CLE4_9AGAR
MASMHNLPSELTALIFSFLEVEGLWNVVGVSSSLTDHFWTFQLCLLQGEELEARHHCHQRPGRRESHFVYSPQVGADTSMSRFWCTLTAVYLPPEASYPPTPHLMTPLMLRPHAHSGPRFTSPRLPGSLSRSTDMKLDMPVSRLALHISRHSISTSDLPPAPNTHCRCRLRVIAPDPQLSSTCAARYCSMSISSRPPIFRARPRRARHPYFSATSWSCW